jgi:hypothetical protein
MADFALFSEDVSARGDIGRVAAKRIDHYFRCRRHALLQQLGGDQHFGRGGLIPRTR